MGVWGQGGGSEFAGYDYVQTAEPAEPTEGQTWYDIDVDAAFVYDGAGWIEMTVTDHGQLANVSAGQHRSDQNIRTTVNGQVDADTVDGQHASAFATSLAGGRWSTSMSGANSDSDTVDLPGPVVPMRVWVRADDNNGTGNSAKITLTLDFQDGSSQDYVADVGFGDSGTVTNEWDAPDWDIFRDHVVVGGHADYRPQEDDNEGNVNAEFDYLYLG